MPYTVRDLTPLFLNTTSTTATVGVGHLDDASSITIFLASSASALSSGGLLLQVSQFDPADKFPQGSEFNAGPTGITQSSAFYTVTSSLGVLSTLTPIVLSNISFRGLRLIGFTASGNSTGEFVAYATKQITV